MKGALAFAAACIPLAAAAADLPATLSPGSDFPAILTQAPSIERLAPNVQYGDYELWTADGPLSVHVVAVYPSAALVRIGVALAHDALGPIPETVSSMAERTGAVAGINGDYFDIGRTNSPTNVVVRNGSLIRTPIKRYALAISSEGRAQFVEFSFAGTARFGTRAIALEAVDVMPPEGSAALITPAFGTFSSSPERTIVALQPLGSVPFGSFRITSFPADGAQPAGYYLVLRGVPSTDFDLDVGATIAIDGTLSPVPLDALSDSIGGGPLLLRDGRWISDPDGPSGGLQQRIPCSGAATESDGTLLLVEVDGRQPERSVGLTRREFAELMRSLGAEQAMAFDGGGSSAMAVRFPGMRDATLATSPSDGVERPVADGIFVYDVAPIGPATRVAGEPRVIAALPGAAVPIRAGAVDASLHPVDSGTVSYSVEPPYLGRVVGSTFRAMQTGSGIIRLRSGDVSGQIPVRIDSGASRVQILPAQAYAEPGQSIVFQARAFDARGYDLALPSRLPWSASAGAIDDSGTFTATDRDAVVRLDFGGHESSALVRVGTREVSLALPNSVSFLTFPKGGTGSAELGRGCAECIRLTYAIGPLEEAAYAVIEQDLPNDAVGLSFNVRSDGNGALLRVALRNAIDEQMLVSAIELDSPQGRHVVVRFPQPLIEPLRLVGLYAVGTPARRNPQGTVVVGDLHVLVAGQSP